MGAPQNRLGPILGIGSLSGLLFTLSIPCFDLYPLAWICLLPCFLALSRTQAPFALGLAAGLVAATGRIYWLVETLQLYGSLSFLAGLCTTVALVFYLALYSAVFFWICARLPRESPLFAWIAASLWALLEWAQGWIITGFPWELLGYSQYLNRPLAQVASLAGVYGLSFLIVLVNAALAQILACRSRWPFFAGPPALLLGLALLWGLHRLSLLETKSGGEPLEIGILQGSISQGEKWKGDRLAWTTQRYVELACALPAGPPLDLVIFPETALPFYLQDPGYAAYRDRIAALARQLRAPLLVGSLDRQSSGVYNRAFLLDAQGELAGYADKVHLVPFGEYLPLPWLFQYLEGLTAESGVFAPGAGYQALALKDHRLGVFICYESIFPQIPRALARLGATLLINTTNDAWFGRSAAPYQHFSMCVVRAIETGRPIVRVANTGISGLISPSGQILATTPLFEPVALRLSVIPRAEETFYAQHGDFFLGLCALFLAGVAGWHRRQKKAPGKTGRPYST